MRIHISTIFWIAILGSLLAACGGNGSTTATATSAHPTAATQSAQATSTASTTVCPSTASSQKAFTIVPNGSEASYRVQEQFFNRDLPNDAIGKTNNIQGAFLLTITQSSTISALKMTVDLRNLTSDQQRRDDAIKNHWLESNTYPFAVFVAKDVLISSQTTPEGQNVTFSMPGNMTIHQTTRSETFHVIGKMRGDTISGTATTNILMKNYGFDAPDIAGLLKVKDGVTLTVKFQAKQSTCAQDLS